MCEKLLNSADNTVFMEASKCFHEKSYSCTELHSPIVYLHLPMLRMNKRYTEALIFDKKESTMQTEGFYLILMLPMD